MFRINSDCNNDGQWTEAEQFDDTGLDGCFDENESGYMYLLDADGNLTNEKDEINSYTCQSSKYQHLQMFLPFSHLNLTQMPEQHLLL